MSATATAHGNGYRAGLRLSTAGRAAAALAVGALHVGALAALLLSAPDDEPPAPVLLQVRMIAEAAPVIPVPPPPPQRPAPKPRLVATPNPAPTAIATPPPEPEAVAEPVADLPAPAAPPAPAPAPAEPAPAEPTTVPPNFVAAYLNNPPPLYPHAARLRRESGEVRLRVLVNADGSAGDVRIEQSSGSTALDQAARDIVFRRWRFVPAKRGEVPVEAWVIVPIVFALKP